MAERDPGLPQVEDSELEAGLIRTLSIIGKLGRLNVLDVVLPVVSLGSVVTPRVDVSGPVWTSSDVFSEGRQQAVAALTVHADTLALEEGTYDCKVQLSARPNGQEYELRLRHRNAANTADLMATTYQFQAIGDSALLFAFDFAYTLAEDERLQVVNVQAGGAGSIAVATIWAVRRT